MTPQLIAHCRAGFEPEAARDLARIANTAGTTLDADAAPGRGYVVGQPVDYNVTRFARALDATAPVFVRSLFVGTGPHPLFDPTRQGRPDRVLPLMALVNALRADMPLRARAAGPAFAELRLETPDTNEGKELSGLCHALAAPLAAAARESRALAGGADDRGHATLPRLHVLFIDGAHAYVGVSAPPWGSAWLMGIPRIRKPHGAPSRSTLKLAEAFVTFLGGREPDLLRAGMRAVDLGAAPGGWTWQLASRGMRVTAIDNGPLKGEVAQDSLVTHLRVDGLTYRPKRPVDWMVCDIVEQPSRIAALIARWIGEGHARRTIFNLKLPMKKRYDEVLRCRAIIAEALVRAGGQHTLEFRQLYHDRAEVTGVLRTQPIAVSADPSTNSFASFTIS